MLAVECPQCGAATPAFPLAPEWIQCRACRYEGAPRPEVVAQIRAGAAQLGTANAEHASQLAAARARALVSVLRNRKHLHTVLVLLLLPLGTCGGCSTYSLSGDDPDLAIALMFGLPVILFAAAVTLASRKLSAQVRLLTDLCSAVPPAMPGAAARCHLCAGPLPPATVATPVVRCLHCNTDNVASPEVLNDVIRRRAWVLGHHGQALAQRGSGLGVQGSSAVVLAAFAGLGAPVVGILAAQLLEERLSDVRLTATDASYVLVDFGGLTCAARVREKRSDGKVVLAVDGEIGGTSTQTFGDGPLLVRHPASWFVGQMMRTPTNDTPGLVRLVDVSLLRPRRNQIGVDTPSFFDPGTTYLERSPLAGSCLHVASPGSASVIWDVSGVSGLRPPSSALPVPAR